MQCLSNGPVSDVIKVVTGLLTALQRHLSVELVAEITIILFFIPING